MNSTASPDEIIINDTFRTKRTSAYNMLRASEGYQEINQEVEGKEILTFTVDNVHRIVKVPKDADDLVSTDICSFSSSESLDLDWKLNDSQLAGDNNVVDIQNRNGWNLFYRRPSTTTITEYNIIKIEDSINDDGDGNILGAGGTYKGWPGLNGGIFFKATNQDSGNMYVYFDATSKKELIKSAVGGTCTFTIGLLPIAIYNRWVGDTPGSSTWTNVFFPDRIFVRDNISTVTSVNDYHGPGPNKGNIYYLYYKDYGPSSSIGNRRNEESANNIQFGFKTTDDSTTESQSYCTMLQFKSIFVGTAESIEDDPLQIGERQIEIWPAYDDDYSGKNTTPLYTFNKPDETPYIRWDGTSLKKFECKYSKNADGSWSAPLKAEDENGTMVTIIDNVPTTLVGGGSVETGADSDPNNDATEDALNGCPKFGNVMKKAGLQQYAGYTEHDTIGGLCYMVVKQFDYSVEYYPTDTIYLFFIDSDNLSTDDGKTFEEAYSYFKDDLTFNIVASNKVVVDWKFINKQNEIDISTTGSTIQIGDDWANEDTLSYFGMKNKVISVTSLKGGITSFNNPNSLITSIDVTQLNNLESLDLSGNKLEYIDLSKNIKLTTVDLSNNPQLAKIILPKELGNNLSLNITGCPILSEIVFPTKNTSGSDIIITATSESTLNVRHLEIKNTGEFPIIIKSSTAITFPEIKKVTLQNAYLSVGSTSYLTINDNIHSIDLSGTSEYFNTIDKINTLANILPDRTDKEPGWLFIYGQRYTDNNGDTGLIKSAIEEIKNKNWLLYL